MADSTTELDWVTEVGKPAYESIAEMVACLQADRERLEELREERDGYQPDTDGPEHSWASMHPDDAEELKELEDAVQLDCAGEDLDEDEARQRIEEDPLSLRIFGEKIDGNWEADEFELLLATGGPAVRIVGDLGQHNEPCRPRLEVQDWFKPWTEYVPADKDILLAYCQCFYFGD